VFPASSPPTTGFGRQTLGGVESFTTVFVEAIALPGLSDWNKTSPISSKQPLGTNRGFAALKESEAGKPTGPAGFIDKARRLRLSLRLRVEASLAASTGASCSSLF